MTVLNNEDPADPSVHEPVETVPWPEVTRYSGGASHEGIGGRVWIRLSDDGPEVEYVPAMPARVALSDEQIRQCADVAHGRGPNTVGVVSDFAVKFARAVIAEYERANGIGNGEQA